MTTGGSLRSVRWGYFRIIAGTVIGGVLGFYVMHRVENSYKEKVKERLARYEREMMLKNHQQQRGEADGGDQPAE